MLHCKTVGTMYEFCCMRRGKELKSFCKILHLTECGQINTCPKGNKFVASSFYTFFYKRFYNGHFELYKWGEFFLHFFHNGVNLDCENTVRNYFQHINMVQSSYLSR